MPDDEKTRQQRRADARKDREELETKTARGAAMRKRLAVLGGIVAAAVVVVVVLLLATGGSDDTAPVAKAGEAVAGQTQSAALLQGIPQDGRFLGDPKAPVTMVEWADVQCPFCKEYTDNALPTVINDFVRTGKVRLEFRSLPILADDADSDSNTGAKMLAAAAEQDKLWNVLEILYANQGAEQSGWLSEDLQTKAFQGAGVDTTKAKAALDSTAVTKAVAEDQTTADQLKLTSTPSFIAGPTGGEFTVLQVQRLDAQWFSSALTAALNQAKEAS